jgi:hypothetical protein
MAILLGALATLGLAVIALAGTSVVARRRFRSRPQAFACRVRTPARGGRRRRRRRWSRWRTRACWLSDVLLVRSAPLGLSFLAYAVRIAPGARLRPVSATDVRRLGPMPWALLLTTDDGPLDVAVADGDKERLVGPYLAAALTGLPSAPHEGRG